MGNLLQGSSHPLSQPDWVAVSHKVTNLDDEATSTILDASSLLSTGQFFILGYLSISSNEVTSFAACAIRETDGVTPVEIARFLSNRAITNPRLQMGRHPKALSVGNDLEIYNDHGGGDQFTGMVTVFYTKGKEGV